MYVSQGNSSHARGVSRGDLQTVLTPQVSKAESRKELIQSSRCVSSCRCEGRGDYRAGRSSTQSRVLSGGIHHHAAAGRAHSQGVRGPRPSLTPCQEAEGLPACDGTGEAPGGSQGVLPLALQSEVAAGQSWCSFEAGRLLPSCVHQGPRAKGGRLLSFPGLAQSRPAQ